MAKIYRLDQLQPRLAAFRNWLVARGAELLTLTNEWEVCRFRTMKGTSVIYSRKRGDLTFTNEAQVAIHAFETGASWRAVEASKRKLKSTPMCRALRERDGDKCFYCRQTVEVVDESIEHLVAITHGGPDHIANMVLAHRAPCNAEAGHLSVMEKIRRREEMAKPGPPWEV